ncbi:hypothetical protein HNP46_005416 [Pseudomonas nitritireducens]|uniref:Outer membrane assembly lipoprotein YfiO n=1 Tax=Pseudomonas nitroreducens TaxID=46680 RepID=A0A7W7P3C7_PSENT|nr:hypothetical protein [Pseudomonas nitritireducens]
MRLHGLTLLALITGCLAVQEARASSDDSCYPSWNLKRDSLDVCNNLPFLSPGNDSRVNLQLLLADAGQASIPNRALSDDEQQLGYGQVPFPLARWSEGAAAGESTTGNASTAQLADLAARIGLPADSLPATADSFASGEGSRCRSNNVDTARDFLSQLLLTDSLTGTDRQGLAGARLTLLGACQWDETQLSVLLPGDLQGAQAKAYRSYLKGAADFYSGRFGEALKSFRGLLESDQPWLKETARYMVARALLNQAQQNAFDEMGYPDLRKVDKKLLAQAETALGDYLKAYPQGQYAASAQGLVRRVYWLMSDESRLAGEYAALFSREDADDLAQLVQEVDNKLLVTAHPADVRDARLLAVLDLMQMRHRDSSEPRALDSAGLAAQKDLFAKYPGLHDYLTAAYQLYVEENPEQALQSLPEQLPSRLDYLAFSQQTLRGFALEAGNDWIGAEKLWLRLLPLAARRAAAAARAAGAGAGLQLRAQRPPGEGVRRGLAGAHADHPRNPPAPHRRPRAAAPAGEIHRRLGGGARYRAVRPALQGPAARPVPGLYRRPRAAAHRRQRQAAGRQHRLPLRQPAAVAVPVAGRQERHRLRMPGHRRHRP